MSVPSPEQIGLVQRWWQYATEDLQAAELLMQNNPEVPRHICAFAQQAAEKALKTALVLEQIDFPKTHDLDLLKNLLPDSWGVKHNYPQLGILTDWFLVSRYPILRENLTEANAREALELARAIWHSILQDLLTRQIPLEV